MAGGRGVGLGAPDRPAGQAPPLPLPGGQPPLLLLPPPAEEGKAPACGCVRACVCLCVCACVRAQESLRVYVYLYACEKASVHKHDCA